MTKYSGYKCDICGTPVVEEHGYGRLGYSIQFGPFTLSVDLDRSDRHICVECVKGIREFSNKSFAEKRTDFKKQKEATI